MVGNTDTSGTWDTRWDMRHAVERQGVIVRSEWAAGARAVGQGEKGARDGDGSHTSASVCEVALQLWPVIVA